VILFSQSCRTHTAIFSHQCCKRFCCPARQLRSLYIVRDAACTHLTCNLFKCTVLLYTMQNQHNIIYFYDFLRSLRLFLCSGGNEAAVGVSTERRCAGLRPSGERGIGGPFTCRPSVNLNTALYVIHCTDQCVVFYRLFMSCSTTLYYMHDMNMNSQQQAISMCSVPVRDSTLLFSCSDCHIHIGVPFPWPLQAIEWGSCRRSIARCTEQSSRWVHHCATIQQYAGVPLCYNTAVCRCTTVLQDSSRWVYHCAPLEQYAGVPLCYKTAVGGCTTVLH